MSDGGRCAEIRHSLGALACDALDPVETAELTGHLEECPSCQRELAELRETADMVGIAVVVTPVDGPAPAIPARVRESLRDELAARRERGGREGDAIASSGDRGRRRAWWRPGRAWVFGGAGALAGAAAASLIAVFAFSGGSGTTSPGFVGGYDLDPPTQVGDSRGYAWTTPNENGTAFWVRAEGLAPTQSGERYVLRVATDGATTSTAGSFLVPGSGSANARLAAGVELDAITDVRVVLAGDGADEVVLLGTRADRPPEEFQEG